MNTETLPHGLRHVLIQVSFDNEFPPPPGSARDIALLRTANRAMQRRERGPKDAFLFVFVGRHDYEHLKEAVSAYGFPNAAVRYIESDDSLRMLEMGDGNSIAEIDDVIQFWLNEEHGGAVSCPCGEYPGIDFWWSGVEHDDDVFDWPFGVDDFAKTLPTTQRSRAATWLTVLGHAVGLHAAQVRGPDVLGQENAAAWAITHCEWLHGFEAASGNGYNNFGEDPIYAITPSDFYLGFELARISGDDLDTLCEDHDSDVEDLKRVAISNITSERIYELREALSDFFGGDGGLFWALYSAVWPQFHKPMHQACDDLLGTTDHDEIAELDAPWRFVSEGWCDEADN